MDDTLNPNVGPNRTARLIGMYRAYPIGGTRFCKLPRGAVSP